MGNEPKRTDQRRAERIRAALATRSIVFVGMMGAGKTTVGRRVAARLDLPFVDVDVEIERAAAQTIPEIFAEHGETYFRDGERRVIARLLAEGPQVLATGGGAFMNAETRTAIAEAGVSVWLEAAPEVLWNRVRHRTHRPLLANPDPEGTLRRLVAERYPTYALADLTVPSRDAPKDLVADEIVEALDRHFTTEAGRRSADPSSAAPASGESR
jgi:shikimate kinase